MESRDFDERGQAWQAVVVASNATKTWAAEHEAAWHATLAWSREHEQARQARVVEFVMAWRRRVGLDDDEAEIARAVAEQSRDRRVLAGRRKPGEVKLNLDGSIRHVKLVEVNRDDGTLTYLPSLVEAIVVGRAGDVLEQYAREFNSRIGKASHKNFQLHIMPDGAAIPHEGSDIAQARALEPGIVVTALRGQFVGGADDIRSRRGRARELLDDPAVMSKFVAMITSIVPGSLRDDARAESFLEMMRNPPLFGEGYTREAEASFVVDAARRHLKNWLKRLDKHDGEGRPRQVQLLLDEDGEALVAPLSREPDPASAASADDLLALLDERERHVATLMVQGCSKAEIARRIDVHKNRVWYLVRRIHSKLAPHRDE